MIDLRNIGPRALVRVTALILLLPLGCGSKTVYPVHGQIVDAEGQPVSGLAGGAVEFDGGESRTSANASIADDGTFKLSTSRAGDGAHLGKHRVAITRPYKGPENPVPPVIDTRYERFETSGLEVVVEPKDNEVKLTVQRVKRR
jgi:hypothetical protein